MSRAWYATDRFLLAAKRVALFVAVVVAYFLLINIPFIANIDAWGRHQLVRLGTTIGGAAQRVFASPESLSAQLAVCEEDRLALANASAHESELEREVAELQGLLAFASRSATPGIAAHILARAVGGSTTVTIDRGTDDGIELGMAAVIGDGIFYGIVSAVDVHRATVRLSTDRASDIPAAVIGKRKTIGMVEGQEGALLAMDYIPQDAELAVNDLVVTSGLDGIMPEGLVIGTVSDVVIQESAPFKRAVIEPLHDPREWSSLMLIPPQSQAGL